jgi:hypothetical protein
MIVRYYQNMLGYAAQHRQLTVDYAPATDN